MSDVEPVWDLTPADLIYDAPDAGLVPSARLGGDRFRPGDSAAWVGGLGKATHYGVDPERLYPVCFDADGDAFVVDEDGDEHHVDYMLASCWAVVR